MISTDTVDGVPNSSKAPITADIKEKSFRPLWTVLSVRVFRSYDYRC